MQAIINTEQHTAAPSVPITESMMSRVLLCVGQRYRAMPGSEQPQAGTPMGPPAPEATATLSIRLPRLQLVQNPLL